MEIDDLSLTKEPLAAVCRAYQASSELLTREGVQRSRGIFTMAQALEDNFNGILEANTLDLEASREMAIPHTLLEWLRLTPERLQTTIQILRRLGQLPDPIHQAMTTKHQVREAQSYKQLVPLGTIALIYEALPDLAPITAGLCLKTGNSLVLRGGSEANNSNQAIASALQIGLEKAGLPIDTVQILPAAQGSSIRELVTQERFLSLVIPYGRPSFVQQVMQQATAPVLTTAIGNCYLYWSINGNLDLVRWMIADSHISEPDAVNAIEKVLITKHHKPSALTLLWNNLKDKGFELRGDADLVAQFPEQLKLAADTEWSQPYLRKVIAFKAVEDLAEAIAWINRYSSCHADAIATDSYAESREFNLKVDSASIYINTSPRFYRAVDHSPSVFLGMSNRKGVRRGLIGVDSLTTTKEVIQGKG
jgi:glutamate-5-semialdehyde dehydrogenase